MLYKDIKLSPDMTAEEMFAKLGFAIQWTNKNGDIRYIQNFYLITFDVNNKTVINELLNGDVNYPRYKPFEIPVPLLKAINKQIEELGW